MRKLIGISLVSLLLLFCFSCGQNPNATQSQSIIGSMQVDIATLKASVTALNSAVTSLQSIPAGASKAQIDSLTAELNSNISKVNTLQSQLNTLQSQVNAIQTPNLTSYAKQTQLDALQAQVSALATHTATTAQPTLTQIATIQVDIATLKTQLATIQTQLNDASAKITALQTKDLTLEARIGALESLNRELASITKLTNNIEGCVVEGVVYQAGLKTFVLTVVGDSPDSSAIEIAGTTVIFKTISADAQFDIVVYSAGKAFFTAGDDTVSGNTITRWNSLMEGGTIRKVGEVDEWGILSVDDEDLITLVEPYGGTTSPTAGSSYVITYQLPSGRVCCSIVLQATWAANTPFAVSIEGLKGVAATIEMGVG